MIDTQAEQIIRGNPDKSSADIVALIAALPPVAKPSNPATTYATYLLIGLMFGDNPAGSLRSQLPTWGSPTDLSTLNAALPNPGALQALHARLDGYPGVDMASPNAPALLGLFSTGIPAINLAPLLTSDQANALLAIGYQLPVVPTVDEVDAWRAIETRRLLLQKIVNAGASLLNDYLPTLVDPTTAAPTQATVVAEFQSLLNAGGLA